MDHFATLTLHEQLVEIVLHNVSERCIKDLWNSLWTTRNSCGPPGLRRETMV